MSDETNTSPAGIDDVLQRPPMEDYSGDDTQSAHGTVVQPYDDQDTGATDDPITDATELPDDPSLGG
jgi:hypothetical protein